MLRWDILGRRCEGQLQAQGRSRLRVRREGKENDDGRFSKLEVDAIVAETVARALYRCSGTVGIASTIADGVRLRLPIHAALGTDLLQLTSPTRALEAELMMRHARVGRNRVPRHVLDSLSC